MALSEDTMSKCSEHLSSYKSACEAHPDLKSFDSSLQQRTNKVIDSLAAGADRKTGLLSPHAAHMEFSKHLHEVSQGVADFIVNSEDDVWENKAIRSLVQAYFDSTNKTLEILNNVMKCVDKAKMGQLIILQAVAQFDKESAENDVGGKKKKYEKTLKKLKKFSAMGDPFDVRELTTQFELVKKQQESLVEEVSEARKKLQDEYANLHTASVFSNLVFGAAFFCAAAASIILLATGVGAVVGIGLALSLPLIAIGWVGVHTTLEKRMDALKRQEEALKELEDNLKSEGGKGTETNKNAMESVSEQVLDLERNISFILKVVDDTLESEEEETDTRLALTSIRDEVEKLTEGIKEVGEAVSRSRKLIVEARYHVMEKINGSA